MLLVLAWLFLGADPDAARPLLQQGLLALQHGELAEARKDLEQASRLDATNPYVWSSLAEVYLRMKEPQKALAAAKTAEANGERNPVVSHALAMFYSEAGDLERAAELEEKFAASGKGDANATARAAELYVNAGDGAKALPLAREAVAKADTPATEDLMGRALLLTGERVRAAERFKTAWEGARTDPQIVFDYADALLKAQEFSQAAHVIEAALQANSKDAQLTLALGVARYGQRRFEESITLFLQVITLDPRIPQPYEFLGRLLDQAGGHMPEILKDYEAWAGANPQNAKAQMLLAKALLAVDPKSRRAEALLRRSIALDTTDWEAHFQLGVWLADQHEYAAAAAELNRSIELNGKEAMPHYHLARVYDRLGEPEKAKAEREIHQRLTAPAGQ